MQQLRRVSDQADQRNVSHAMPGVLRAAGADRAPKQATSGRDAGGHRTQPYGTYTRGSLGVRRPDVDETPLSWDEVMHGVRFGVFG